MNKPIATFILAIIFLISCGEDSKKKRGLDDTLFKYAASIRWSNYDGAIRFLKPGVKEIVPSSFELEHLKQFKVSSYSESPITPGPNINSISQTVTIQLYNIHNNQVRTIIDNQTWEYNEEWQQWLLTSGIPKIK
ncbi:MAG: hypothetical protein AB8B80_09045 [Marinicellaceae bacterium]